MIHSILSVQFTCLTVFLHNLFQVIFGLPLGPAPSTSYSIHFFTQSLFYLLVWLTSFTSPQSHGTRKLQYIITLHRANMLWQSLSENNKWLYNNEKKKKRTYLHSTICTLHGRSNRVLETIRPEIDNGQQLQPCKKHPLNTTGTTMPQTTTTTVLRLPGLCPWLPGWAGTRKVKPGS